MTAVGQTLDEILRSLDGVPGVAPSARVPPVPQNPDISPLSTAGRSWSSTVGDRPPAQETSSLSTTLGSSACATVAPARDMRPHLIVFVVVIVVSGLLIVFLLLGIFGSHEPRRPFQPPLAVESEQKPAVRAGASAEQSSPMPEPTMTASTPASETTLLPADAGVTPDAPAEAPQAVAVSIESTPSGATLLLASGAELGKTPFQRSLNYGEQDVRVVVRLRGDMDKLIVVRPDKPISLQVKLVAAPREPQSKDRDYSVNPFKR